MTRKSRHIVPILLVLVLTLVLAACQASPSPAAAGTSAPAAAATTKAADSTAAADPATAADLPFVTITHYATGDPNPNGMLEKVQTEWNKLLKERINCELIQVWIPWADYLTKYNLLLASGDNTIDLFEASSTWLEMWQNADRGAWAKLDDLLPVYAPLTWAEIPQADWDQCRFKGDIICIPENGYTQYVNHGIMYRGDWAEAAGLPLQLTTIEQFEEYCDYIKANMPGVFPMDVKNDFNFYENWLKMYTDFIPILGVNQTVSGASLDDPYTAVASVFDDFMYKWADDMHRWNEKGYWREDVLNNTSDLRESLKAGTSGVDLHHVQTFRGLKYQMDVEKFPDESNLQILLWSDLDNGELVEDPILHHGAMCVYAYSKNPERAVMVYEMIRQDSEMYHLFNFGIEGVNYEIDAEGYKVRPAGWNEGEHQYSSNFWAGRVDRFEYKSRTEWPGIYDLWARLDTQVVSNPYSQFAFDIAPVSTELTSMNALWVEQRALISLGKTNDPHAAVDSIREKLKAAGYEKYLAEVQKQLDEYKAMKES